jgi:hypothetical protein
LMNPEIVQNAHLEFLKAGWNIITTNNYAAVPKCLRFQKPSSLKIDVGKVPSKDATENTHSIDCILQETRFFKNGEVNQKVNIFLFEYCNLIWSSSLYPMIKEMSNEYFFILFVEQRCSRIM